MSRKEWDGEIAVGAFLCARELINSLQKILRKAKWLKSGMNVTKYTPSDGTAVEVDLRAVHASQAGAAEMNAASPVLPDALAELIGKGTVTWKPGLRVCSASCSGFAATAGAAGNDAVDPPLFTYSELFAGIGGFRVALQKLGGGSSFCSEIDPEARAAYELSFGEKGLIPDQYHAMDGHARALISPPPHCWCWCCVLWRAARGISVASGDITEIEGSDIGHHDILTAGFPCQTFSRAGRQQGFSDPRGLLFLEIVRVLRQCRPRCFLLENVANLVHLSGGALFAKILADLEDAGYVVDWRLINSRMVLPQQRLRVYIIGRRADLAEVGSFQWPELPVLDTILADVLEPPGAVDTDPKVILSEHQFEKVRQSSDYAKDPSLRLARPSGCARTLMSSYRNGYSLQSEFVLRPGAERPRFFTLRECARLQGFPSEFNFGGANANRGYFQLGNAVCPVVIAAIAAALLTSVGRPIQAAVAECGIAEGPRLRRNIVIPALDLLLSSAPDGGNSTRSQGRTSLRDAVNRFVAGDGDGPACSYGVGAALSDDDCSVVNASLASGRPEAQLVALHTLGELAHRERTHEGDKSGTTGKIVEEGLVKAAAGCLGSPHGEVLRRAVVTLATMSRLDALGAELATCVEAIAKLTAIANDPAGDARLAKQAKEALSNTKGCSKLV